MRPTPNWHEPAEVIRIARAAAMPVIYTAVVWKHPADVPAGLRRNNPDLLDGGTPRGTGAPPCCQVPGLLAEFASYLARERGLSPASVNSYLRHARPFLAGLDAPLATALAGLSAAQVAAFMTGHRGQWGTGTAKATVTALRSLLCFLHATGRVPQPLASAVPPVAGWKLAPLPPGGLRFRRGRARAVHSPARQSTSPSSAAATSPARSPSRDGPPMWPVIREPSPTSQRKL